MDPEAHRRGYGRMLLSFAEAEVRLLGGRLLLIETSSLESYKSTGKFYLGMGYALMAQIPEFYKPGDDKLIFGKHV